MPNPYQLAFPERLGLDLSVFAFTLDEALDSPFLLDISVTSSQAHLPLAKLIHQPVSFTITPPAATVLPPHPRPEPAPGNRPPPPLAGRGARRRRLSLSDGLGWLYAVLGLGLLLAMLVVFMQQQHRLANATLHLQALQQGGWGS